MAAVKKITPDGRLVPVVGYGYGSAYTYLPLRERSVPILDYMDFVFAIAVDRGGNLFVAGLDSLRRAYRIGTDGMMEVHASYPTSQNVVALAADGSGNLFFLLTRDLGFFQTGTVIVKMLPDKSVVPVAGTGTAGSAGDNGPAASAQLSASDLAVDSRGTLYLPDGSGNIRKITLDGIISRVAPGVGPITVDGSDRLYFFLRDGTLQRLNPDGLTESLALMPNASGVAVDASGKVYVTSGGRLYALDASGSRQLISGCGCYGDGVPLPWAAVQNAVGVARDVANNLYFSDTGNHTIRRVAPDGTTTIFAGTGDPGFSGDGAAARLARLSSPSGLAVDAVGNLYVADRGNNVIRQIGPDGTIRTVAGNGIGGFSGDGGPATAARLALPDGIAVDGAGNLYIADTANHRLRKVGLDGNIGTIAGSDNYGTSGDGGPAIRALLINPRSLAFDLDGNLVFTDSSAHMVRRITPGGIIQRVSGTGAPGSVGDGGPAISAQNRVPWGLTVDRSGNILIGDTGTGRLRMIDRSGVIRTLVNAQATGLTTDAVGNYWVAGGAISVVTESDPPVPLPPVIPDGGVRNTATDEPAVVAPGEMVTIHGTRLGPATEVSAAPANGLLGSELGGVRVWFDDVAAPLLRVGGGQIQAIVPFDVSGKETVGVRVEYLGAESNTAVLSVLPAVPGVFRLDNVRKSATISIVVTGVGKLSPAEADGQFATSDISVPVLPLSATFGVVPIYDPEVPWTPVQITYAGSVNWLPAGTIQINLKLPDTLPQSTNSNYQIALRVGNSLVTTAFYIWP